MSAVTLPHDFSPRDYQLELLQDERKFKVAVWHRRGGKSKTALNEQVRKAHLPGNEGKLFYYFLPTYAQAKRVIWDELIKKHIPDQLVAKFNSSELAIYYKNGSIQRFCGCEEPQSHKGINPIDVVFDEYQAMDETIWTEVVQPILRENGGTATFIGTPSGKNHFWKIFQAAKQNPDWFWSLKTVDDTKGISEEELEAAAKETPQALFQQEYYCEFTENAGAVFHRIKDNIYEAKDISMPGHSYRLGVDLAKYNDWTVITPFDESTFEVLPQIRFNQVDWMIQEARIKTAAYKYNNAQLILDRTGVGDSVVDRLENDGLNVGDDGRVVFTEKSKRDLLNNLIVLLENDKIKIPNDEGLITELQSMQYSLTDKGRVKSEVPKGMTDDRIWSLALAVYGVEDPIGIMELSNFKPNNTSKNLYDAI